MYINKINQTAFGVSLSEIMVRTAEYAKKQKPALPAKKPTLYAQLLLQDKFFSKNEVSETVKANYFSHLITGVSK